MTEIYNAYRSLQIIIKINSYTFVNKSIFKEQQNFKFIPILFFAKDISHPVQNL